MSQLLRMNSSNMASSWSFRRISDTGRNKMAALLYSVSDREMDQEHSFMRYDFLIVCGHVAYCTDINNND
jgi:hypothetical protein